MSQQQNVSQTEKPEASNGVKYILDFDDTIFDASGFKTVLKECGIPEDTVSGETFALIQKVKPDFDIKTLIFPDALAFLKEHTDDCEIVTTYLSRDAVKNTNIEARKKYQSEKIVLSGIVALLGTNHVHVVGQSKEVILSSLLARYTTEGHECVYIDDRKEYIETAEKMGIRTYRMERITRGSFEAFGIVEKAGVITSFLGFSERVLRDRQNKYHE